MKKGNSYVNQPHFTRKNARALLGRVGALRREHAIALRPYPAMRAYSSIK